MSIFEIGMLICFGVSWPVSISKALRSKTVEGKSIVFLYTIAFGYVCGITHKFFYNLDWVTYLYVLNVSMVSFDIFLWHKFSVGTRIKESIHEKIKIVLNNYFSDVSVLKKIRTRRVGYTKYIELFLTFDLTKRMEETQKIINSLKQEIENNIDNSEVMVIPVSL